MNQRINPFHDLYLTEAIGANRFVKLFSPMFVEHGLALYQPGNVILKGLQGSGKTMLLNLLKPEIRMAYRKANEQFPVPENFSKFIASGINLRKSGVAVFAQLIEEDSDTKFVQELALYFGDFVNYWIVGDLLSTVELFMRSDDSGLLEELGVDADGNLDAFAKMIGENECWFGFLSGVDDFNALKQRLRKRISVYRQYINLNLDELPEAYKKSKTVIGNPIATTAELLRKSGIIEQDVQVYVRIDQYEELPTLDFSHQGFGNLCQQILHKALSSRDTRVSYRIGVRQYAWPELPKIFPTTGALERKRDYSVVNIDDILRRKENRKTWIFPEFAEDIFRRRLQMTNYVSHGKSVDFLTRVFGPKIEPIERVKKLVPNVEARASILNIDRRWSEEWVAFIKHLAKEDPLSAHLAGAWVRQLGKEKKKLIYDIPDAPYPWEEKKYWKKERIDQALLQIASKNKQQLIWAGVSDVLGISGGNILIFLFICQQIWDAWLRATRSCSDILLPSIDDNIQSIGFLNASEEWFKKLSEGPRSALRARFMDLVGERYYGLLTDDLAMSYPGNNGFSVKLDELKKNKDLEQFLQLASDYGDLYESPHTSKTKGEKRRKYYLAPILCPGFKIPYKHTKEPEYISLNTLREWFVAASSGKPLPPKRVNPVQEEFTF